MSLKQVMQGSLSNFRVLRFKNGFRYCPEQILSRGRKHFTLTYHFDGSAVNRCRVTIREPRRRQKVITTILVGDDRELHQSVSHGKIVRFWICTKGNLTGCMMYMQCEKWKNLSCFSLSTWKNPKVKEENKISSSIFDTATAGMLSYMKVHY